jgi:hypothetical protein
VQLSRSKARVAPWNPRIPVEIQTTSRRESIAHVYEEHQRVPAAAVAPASWMIRSWLWCYAMAIPLMAAPRWLH